MKLRLLTGLWLSFLSTSLFAHSFSYTDVGEGKPILLIHAFPTDQRLWKPQQDQLKNHFRVITLDLRGFGQTEATDGSAVTMADYAKEVKALLDMLHINKAIIGGESMGGYIALAFLQHYPEAVEGLILADTQSIADTDEIKAKREASARDVLSNGTSAFLAGFMTKALSSHAPEDARVYLKEMVTSQPATAIASALRGMALREDTTQVLAQTMVPMLIITGEEDALISPKQSEIMHGVARNSRLVVIEGAGHLASLEKPVEWNLAIDEMF